MLKNQSYQWLFINDCFSEKMLVIRKEKWKKVKELSVARKNISR